MARIDRARLDNGVFPARCDVIPRFSDLDRNGHLNNVAIGDLLQEGRFRFCFDFGMDGTPDRQVVIASGIVEYAGDLLYPERVEISTGVLEIGRTSFRVGQVARQNGHIAVYAEAVMVIRNDDGSIPIPDDWREKLEALRLK